MKTIAAAMLMSLAAHTASQAAVIAVSGYTDNGSYGLTSVTINSTTYNSLTGSTASILSGGGTTVVGVWINNTFPTLTTSDINAAASGLSYREGAGNILTNSTFQFGRSIIASDRIFLWDFGTGDPVSFGLVDSGGSAIGDYSISLTAANFGATALVSFGATGVVQADGTQTIVAVDQQRAVSFQIADFTGTTGNLSLATGIRLTAGSGSLDPSVVGLAAIPEPTTWALLAGSLTVLMVTRRRRSH